jgi:hypothetical protein
VTDSALCDRRRRDASGQRQDMVSLQIDLNRGIRNERPIADDDSDEIEFVVQGAIADITSRILTQLARRDSSP